MYYTLEYWNAGQWNVERKTNALDYELEKEFQRLKHIYGRNYVRVQVWFP